GNFLDKGEPIQEGTPAVLHPLLEGPPNRLTLARWLVAAENPLVARVTVNRWWMEFFGRGIVSTPEDFGVKGEPPSHPELLDYLASVFSSERAVNTAQRGRGAEVPRREKPPVINAASDANGLGSSFILHPSSFAPNAQRPTPNASPQGLGWSTKWLLKLIVTSATYRQSSR
ncbi:MAG: DUF1553 domain-containing protein, partial [Gemmataceae bacterium]